MRTSATVHAPWRPVLEQVIRTLQGRGFHVLRTFDLQMARQSLPGGESEPCPHHGAALCSCQYIVMQITAVNRTPSTVVIHGYDNTTAVTLVAGFDDGVRDEMATVAFEALEHLHLTHGAMGG